MDPCPSCGRVVPAPDACTLCATLQTDDDAPASSTGAASAPSSSARSRPTLTIGRYEVVRELGRGGMGVVYEARDTQLGRTVALKLILPGRLRLGRGSRVLARFQREARALARLRHPGIVGIFDVAEEAGQPYLVVEFVSGGGFDAALERGLPLSESVRILRDVARALGAAHRGGIVHRDVKPANVLLEPDGAARLTDFGLAVDSQAGRITGTGEVLGTLAYMAPEQVKGEPGGIGPATDVWAVGAMLYEILTGAPPFVGETPMNTLAAIMKADLRRPSQSTDGVPVALETIVLRCLERDPARRYPTASALADDLDAFLARTRAPGADGRRALAPAVLAVGLGAAAVALVGLLAWAAGGLPGGSRTRPASRDDVVVSAPADDVVTRRDRVEVVGRLADGVAAPELWIAGEPTSVGDDGRFARSVSLTEGANDVVVTFPTADGDLTRIVRRVFRDVAPPGLELTIEPRIGAGGRAFLAGLVSEEADVVLVLDEARLAARLEPPADGSGGHRFRAILALRPGANRIEVTAEDGAGNVARIVRTVEHVPWSATPEQRAAAEALGGPVTFRTSVGLELVAVPAGEFDRGSAEIRHRVRVTRPFYVATTEVTNAQMRALVPDHTSGDVDGHPLDLDEQPAVHVSWTAAVAYCRALSDREGRSGAAAFRLPTEAEWELAARARAAGRWPWGDDAEAAPRSANLRDEVTATLLGEPVHGASPGDDGHRVTAPVGSFPPNRWGLFDVIGNVWEWCSDWHAPLVRGALTDPAGPARGINRVLRGGGWDNQPGVAELGRRHSREPEFRADSFGFRPVTSTPPPR